MGAASADRLAAQGAFSGHLWTGISIGLYVVAICVSGTALVLRDRIFKALGDKPDCGFGTFTNREWVIEAAVWLKLKSLREGAGIASARLWGRGAD